MRILLNGDPFPHDPATLPWNGRGQWPCHWITPKRIPPAPFVIAYRLTFETKTREDVRVHVTADERYELWLDGKCIGRGSERGDPNHWYFETYELELTEGEHALVAKVWTLGEKSPFAQMSDSHGFILCPQKSEWQEKIGTGKAAWETKRLPGYEFTNPLTAWGTGWNLILNGEAMDWHWREPADPSIDEGWTPAVTGLTGMAPGVNDRRPGHILVPAVLPPMMDRPWTEGRIRQVSNPPAGPTHSIPIRSTDDLAAEHRNWTHLLSGESTLTIPPNTRRRVIIDLENYVCAYPRVGVSGGRGAKIRLNWQESLYRSLDSGEKDNRGEVEGKYFTTIWHKTEGVGDTFLPDGGLYRTFDTLWWHAGRYLEVLVETANDSLTLESLGIFETRYPHEFRASFECSDKRLEEIEPIMVRALEMCSHETYMDCPFFEQLQYIGDTRLQALVTYAISSDDRLPKKALKMFDVSRGTDGLTQSRYPNRVLQIIPPFSLWWVAMIHDYARWRGNRAFVADLMNGARTVLDAYRAKVQNGLLGGMDGWNFVDWVPGWDAGMPVDAAGGNSGVLNLQFALVLRKVAQLETWLGEPEMAERHRRTADEIVKTFNDRFWDDRRGLYADDTKKTEFSEHAQCLALLAEAVPEDRRQKVIEGLCASRNLSKTTIYFSHYLFETFAMIGRTDLILSRMSLWFEHPDLGMKTTLEMPEPSRSDCHAWGAHPLFHYYATFLGIRPGDFGFSTVEIRPQPGPLKQLKGSMPTPRGDVSVAIDGDHGSVHLPPGLTGTLEFGGKRHALVSGTYEF